MCKVQINAFVFREVTDRRRCHCWARLRFTTRWLLMMLHVPTATLSFGKRAKNNLTKLIILLSSEVGLLQMNDSEWLQDLESRLDADPDPVLRFIFTLTFSWLYLLSCSAIAEASPKHTLIFIQKYLCLSRLATDKQIFRSLKLELLGNKGFFLGF